MRAHRGLAARRHAYRWNLRGIDAHGRLSARRADPRDRLSAVRRDRSAAPRVAQLRRERREPQRALQRRCAASDRRRRRGRSADAVRDVSERRHPAHLDRIRPRAVPVVAAAACGSGTPSARVAARPVVPRCVHRCREGRDRIHDRPLDHAVARRAVDRRAAVALGGVGHRAVGRGWPPSTTYFRSWPTAAGSPRSDSACSTASASPVRCTTSACQPGRSRLSLAGFNLGVEVGQLAIVLLFLPLAFALRSTWTYRRLLVGGGSLAIAAIASVWLVDRAFEVSVFSALAAR